MEGWGSRSWGENLVQMLTTRLRRFPASTSEGAMGSLERRGPERFLLSKFNFNQILWPEGDETYWLFWQEFGAEIIQVPKKQYFWRWKEVFPVCDVRSALQTLEETNDPMVQSLQCPISHWVPGHQERGQAYVFIVLDIISSLLLGFQVSTKVVAARYGLLGNRLSKREVKELLQLDSPIGVFTSQSSYGKDLLDMSIHIEQAVCSCSDIGFIGHPESTISQNIHHLRAASMCTHYQNYSFLVWNEACDNGIKDYFSYNKGDVIGHLKASTQIIGDFFFFLI